MRTMIINLERSDQEAKKILNKFQYFIFTAKTRPLFFQVKGMLRAATAGARAAGVNARYVDRGSKVTVTIRAEPEYISSQVLQLREFLERDARELQQQHDRDGRLLAAIRRIAGKTGRAARGRAADFLLNCGILITYKVTPNETK